MRTEFPRLEDHHLLEQARFSRIADRSGIGPSFCNATRSAILDVVGLVRVSARVGHQRQIVHRVRPRRTEYDVGEPPPSARHLREGRVPGVAVVDGGEDARDVAESLL